LTFGDAIERTSRQIAANARFEPKANELKRHSEGQLWGYSSQTSGDLLGHLAYISSYQLL